MIQTDREARARLVDYAKCFLKVAARPNEPISVTPERIAAFAAQVRDGCKQDLLRLIVKCADDNLYPCDGKEALLSLGGAIEEGESVELWGLPDCICGKAECVYCGRGFNVPSMTGPVDRKDV